MNLADRLQKLNAQRSGLIAKRKVLIEKRKSAEAVDRDLVRVTAKVLKFERKAEKQS